VRNGHESTNPDAILDGYIDEFLKACLMMMGQHGKADNEL
jgi:peptide chain release factor 2